MTLVLLIQNEQVGNSTVKAKTFLFKLQKMFLEVSKYQSLTENN